MTIYYLDPANGNDANDGLSWGTAWKTLLNGATSARLGTSDSDEIRIAKSPDPISIGNITWTTNSATLTIPTLSNVVVDHCESGWTAGLVTPTYQATYVRQGTNAIQIVLSSTNGKVCYKTLTTSDYSTFSRITFWVNFGTAVNYSAGCPVQIRLCSDTAGNTAVNTFTLPSYYYPANYWVPITIDNVSNLGNSISSIAIYTTSAVSNTIRFDNISVIKSESDSTSLSLNDLIAKNNGNGEYRPINYFDGTTVGINTSGAARGASLVNISTNFQCYPTGTETIDTVKRVSYPTASLVTASAITTPVGQVWIAQGDSIKKTYVGGYNTSTDVIDGETWFDGVTTYGIGLVSEPTTFGCVLVKNLSFIRYYTGFSFRMNIDSSIENISLVNNHVNYQFREPNKVGLLADLNKMVSNVFDINWMYAGAGSIAVVGNAEPAANTYYNHLFLRQKGQQVKIKLKNASIHNNAQIFTSIGYTDFESIGDIYFAATGSNQRPFDLPMVGVLKVKNIYFFGMTASFNNTYCFNNSNNALISRSLRIPQVKVQISGSILRIPGVWEPTTGTSLLNQTRDSTIMFEGVDPSHNINLTSFVQGFSNQYYGGYTILKNINTPLTFYQIFPGDASYNSLNALLVIDGLNGNTNAKYTYLPQGHISGSGATRTGYWARSTSEVYQGTYSWARLWNLSGATISSALTTPERFDLGEIACKANKQVEVSTYVNRKSGTPVPIWLEIFDYNSDELFVSTKMEDGVYDTWTKVTVTYTPTVDTLIQIAYRIGPTPSGLSSTSAVYFDALSITQAD